MNAQTQVAEGFSPGEYLKDELDARGWSQLDLASILNITPVHVNDLIKGRRPFTAELARGLGEALGTSPQYWLNLQSAYELAVSVKTDAQVARRANVFGKYPVRELVKRKWITDSSNLDVLETQLCQFYGISNIDEEVNIPHAARMSTEYGKETTTHAAWFARLKQLAPLVLVNSRYSKRRFENAVTDLKRLCEDAENIRLVPSMLSNYGIRLVIIEHLPGTKLDGGCVWLDEEPVIGVSLRYGRLDHFWFTLMHEMYHIKHEDNGCTAIGLYEDAGNKPDGSKPSEEIRADHSAANALIKEADLEDFLIRKGKNPRPSEVVGFAYDRGVHPAIAAGQIHHRLNNWNRLNKLMVQVRPTVVEVALTDGWGVSVAL